MAARRLEDERFAYFAEALIVFLDLPDAVFRGYEGDDQLLASRDRMTARRRPPRARDRAPRTTESLPATRCRRPRRPPARTRSRRVPPRDGAALGDARPEYAGIVALYEDFPYAWWNDFRRIEDLPAGALAGVPADVAITPGYADISDMLDRKIMGIRLYESQLDRLFGSADAMADAVRGYGAKVAGLNGRSGAAERYWATSRL